MKSFDQLVEIMKTLRDPSEGCPWDVKQNHQSIAHYAVEEAYEVVDAIEHGTTQDLCEELGDLLLQVVFHAQMASEQNHFSVEDVLHAINRKMIERHPHVFEKKKKLTPDEVKVQWDQIKNKDKKKKFLDDVPRSFPALMKAFEIGKKCAKVGFDWETPEQIKDKMDEEWNELQEGLANKDEKNVEEELGDFLFVTAQFVRKLGYNPEIILQKANEKFTNRLHGVEELAQKDQKSMQDCTVDELEQYWSQIKMK
ncbi:MAG: nucleoside triphosphate pyrophosphohydrolase [Bdellovibrionales bacterium]|nr:nucleoside triphosphate pyrophosphohydrolase [Bdellovibrionales bacterium]